MQTPSPGRCHVIWVQQRRRQVREHNNGWSEVIVEAQVPKLPMQGPKVVEAAPIPLPPVNPSVPAQLTPEDVTAFLDWAADPNLAARHEIGVRAVMFLVFMSIIAIATKRKIWREVL